MINFSEKKTSKDVDLGCLLLLVSSSTANNNAAIHQLDEVIIMFYAMHLSVSVTEGPETKTLWAFEKKADRDIVSSATLHSTPQTSRLKVQMLKSSIIFAKRGQGCF